MSTTLYMDVNGGYGGLNNNVTIVTRGTAMKPVTRHANNHKRFAMSNMSIKRLPNGILFLLVMIMSKAVVSTNSHLLFDTNCASCHGWGDLSMLPSILQRYCSQHCNTNTNTKLRLKARSSTKRPLGRRRGLHSPWLILRGGGGTNEKINVTEQQQQHQQATEGSNSNSHNLASQKRVALPLTSMPLIDIKSVSLALRLTCETNRRLHYGTSLEGGGGGYPTTSKASSAAKSTKNDVSQQGVHSYPHQQQQQQQQQQMMMTAASISPAIQTISEEELIKERRKEELTVFHAMKLWEGQTADVVDAVNATGHESNSGDGLPELSKSRSGQTWGPDLQSYLTKLLSAIGLDESPGGGANDNKQASPMEDEYQIILSLMLIYLDRSTSIDTLPLQVDPHTGQSQICPSCPYLLPRTVHRMVLTALAIATKCVRGDRSISNTLRGAANFILGEKCAISEADLEQMENWMVHTLSGDVAQAHHQHYSYWQVSQDELGSFMRKWGGTFYPQRLQAHDQSRMKQLERFWRDQAASVFGGNNPQQQQQHGHGNYYWPERTAGGVDHHQQQHQPSLKYGSDNNQWQSPEQHHSQDHYNMAEQQFYETSSEPF